jgi:DNA-binding NarL/FixJ family response regulator
MESADVLPRAAEQPLTEKTIIVVDDHPLIREALKMMVGLFPRWRVVGEAATAREGLVLVSRHNPDVVLMDIGLPGMDGVIATREVRRRSPETKVLIVTAYAKGWDVREAICAGASGYLLKSDSEALGVALETVARGERYLSPDVAAGFAGEERSAAVEALACLSEREMEVFRLAAECLDSVRIARELCIARKTVDTHLYRIHRKLGIRTSGELVRLAIRLGIAHGGRTRAVAAGGAAPVGEPWRAGAQT